MQQEIQEALDANPLLELEEGTPEATNGEDDSSSATAEASDSGNDDGLSEVADSEAFDTSDAIEQQEMPEDLPVDTTWMMSTVPARAIPVSH